MTAWKARQQRDGNVRHNEDGRHNGNGRGVEGKECGKLGQYHRGSGENLNVTFFQCVYSIVLLAPDVCDTQTKHRHVSPWCGDGAGVLGLGAARP